MNRPSSTLVLAVALGLTLTTLVTLHGQAAGKPRPTAVAVVDLQKVLNNLDEKGAVVADLVRRKEQIDKAKVDRAKEVRDLEADLQVLGDKTDAYKQTIEKAELKAIELDSWEKFERRKLDREAAMQIENLYLKVLDAVKRKAEKDGFDIVLYKDSTESIRATNEQQVAAAMNLRKVLYSAPDLDLTDQVTQMLNNEYNNRPKAAK
jgi:Skp family chaperone for outer membrane proteins